MSLNCLLFIAMLIQSVIEMFFIRTGELEER